MIYQSMPEDLGGSLTARQIKEGDTVYLWAEHQPSVYMEVKIFITDPEYAVFILDWETKLDLLGVRRERDGFYDEGDRQIFVFAKRSPPENAVH